MKKKWLKLCILCACMVLIPAGVVMLPNQMHASENQMECGLTNCDITLNYDAASEDSLLIQLKKIVLNNISPDDYMDKIKLISKLSIINNSGVGIPQEQWVEFRDNFFRESFNYDIIYNKYPNTIKVDLNELNLSSTKFENDELPDAPFQGIANCKGSFEMRIILPNIKHITSSILQGIPNDTSLTIPSTVETVDPDAFQSMLDSPEYTNSQRIDLHNDFSLYYQGLKNTKVKNLSISTNSLSNPNLPLLEGLDLDGLTLDVDPLKDVDLNVWFNEPASNLLDITILTDGMDSFKAVNFKKLYHISNSSKNIKQIDVHGCALYNLSDLIDPVPTVLTKLDISENRFDLTDPAYKEFYQAHKDDTENYAFNGQKPKLMYAESVDDIIVDLGTDPTTINVPVELMYKDKSKFDPDQLPIWIDEAYAKGYKDNVTISCSPKLDTKTEGKYTYRFYFGGESVGTLNLYVVDPAKLVEPTVTVTKAGEGNPEIDAEVTFVAEVTGNAGNVNSGSVTFKQGDVELGTSKVDKKTQKAQLTTQFSSTGTYEITAVYNGNQIYKEGTSTPFSVTVGTSTLAQPTVTLSTAPDTDITTDTEVTLTALLSGEAGDINDGTVTFKNGDDILGTGEVGADHKATLTHTFDRADTYEITAAYGGNTAYQEATSAPLSIVVTSAPIQKKDPTIVLSADPNVDITTDSEVTLTALLSGEAGDINDGTVTFKNGDDILGTGEVGADHKATLTHTFDRADTYEIIAGYGGNTTYQEATSTPISIVVASAPIQKKEPTILLSADPNTNVTIDTEVTLTATVSGEAGDINDGSVTFQYGSTILGTQNVGSDHKAVITHTFTDIASYEIVAKYSGNAIYDIGTSAPVTLEVGASTPVKQASTTVLTITPENALTTDTAVKLEAEVSSAAGIDVDTNGSVQFKVDNVQVGNPVFLRNKKAVLENQKFTAGSHTISAEYSGNANTNASTSTSKSISVTKAVIVKKAQTIAFTDETMDSIYGSAISKNPIIQSKEHGTGAITYTSDHPAIVSIDATTGTMEVHQVGTAVIRIHIAEDDIYKEASDTYTIRIDPKPVSLSGIKVLSKVYDGNTDAKLELDHTIVEGIEGNDRDHIEISAGIGTYDTKDAGTLKPVVLSKFVLSGTAAKNYTLVYPSLTGDITKASLHIKTKDQTKKIGEENPSFTYSITGFVDGENEKTITGYEKPILTTTAQKDSPAGEYKIQASGGMSDNYSFTYEEGVLHIEDEVVPPVIDKKDYTIQGVLGKDGWYTTKVIIKPANGYTMIWNGTAWVSQLSFTDGEYKNISFKLKKPDDTISQETTLEALRVDTVSPEVSNIADGDIYLVNRVFYVKDEFLSNVKINGKTITDFTNGILLEGDKDEVYHIELSDKAGNLKTMSVKVKPIHELEDRIKDLDETTVTIQDKARIEETLENIKQVLADSENKPDAKQKEKLEEMKNNCEKLLQALNTTTDPVKTGDVSTVTGVNTGDIHHPWMLVLFCLCSGCLLVCGYRRTHKTNRG